MYTAFDIALMTSNYSHDIATAMLAISAATMFILWRFYPKSIPQGRERAIETYFVHINRGVTRLAKYSLYWILIAGVPRILYYTKYEWSERAGDLQVAAIIIKHVVMFWLVGTGVFYWHKIYKKVRALKTKHGIT